MATNTTPQPCAQLQEDDLQSIRKLLGDNPHALSAITSNPNLIPLLSDIVQAEDGEEPAILSDMSSENSLPEISHAEIAEIVQSALIQLLPRLEAELCQSLERRLAERLKKHSS